MAKERISQAEYLQLLGLSLIAKQGFDQVMRVRDAMHGLLGTNEDKMTDGGHIGDLIWNGETNVAGMLEKMEIEVEAETVNADS